MHLGAKRGGWQSGAPAGGRARPRVLTAPCGYVPTLAATPRVTAEELKRRLDEGEDILVLDVRRGSWRRSDVKLRGAVRMELEEILRPEGRVPRDVRVVTYCT